MLGPFDAACAPRRGRRGAHAACVALAILLTSLLFFSVHASAARADWPQQAELTAAGSTFLGTAVAVDGDTAVVGAGLDGAHPGPVDVFVRAGTSWSLQAQLNPSDLASQFGNAVAISGNTALVGAPGLNNVGGAAFVFVRSGSTWSQQAELVSPYPPPPPSGAADFGQTVAIDGDTAVVGAPAGGRSGAGAAEVFARSGSTWSHQATLSGSGTAGSFGESVGVSGTTAVVGVRGVVGAPIGSVSVFTRSGSAWSQEAVLTSSDGVSSDGFG
ncbi:MAG: hypothetical protein ACREQ5_27975, partial [Candidatus Dormibacteria bacterium]